MTSLPPTTQKSTSPYRWMIVVLGIVTLGVAFYRLIQINPPEPSSTALRVLSVIPPFSLTERSGKLVTNRDLAGKIWVADFVYTTCPGPCPIVTAGMAKVQDAVAHDPQVMLVTFTVDPTTDTPGVLSRYADQFGADPNRWWFLTGAEKPMDDLIVNGFLQPVQNNTGQPLQPGQFKVTHSTYLALIDGNGNMRGVYSGVDSDGRDKLLHDIKLLEQEAGQ